MRKFLIRWWLTSNWEQEAVRRVIMIWNDCHPLEIAAERHPEFFAYVAGLARPRGPVLNEAEVEEANACIAERRRIASWMAAFLALPAMEVPTSEADLAATQYDGATD